jgi:hypothetical protein
MPLKICVIKRDVDKYAWAARHYYHWETDSSIRWVAYNLLSSEQFRVFVKERAYLGEYLLPVTSFAVAWRSKQ